jgi:hypothetical protein
VKNYDQEEEKSKERKRKSKRQNREERTLPLKLWKDECCLRYSVGEFASSQK